MKYVTFLIVSILLISCVEKEQKQSKTINTIEVKSEINALLNNWHKDASEANFDAYFNAMSNKSVFIGTDAYENWNLEAFKNFSKPHFDKGKAWDFKVLDRNVYFDSKGEIAWFDELLDTWMGVCRGCGVLKKSNNTWKIEHYVLSLTIPNSNIDAVIDLNIKHDSVFVKKFKK